MKGRNNNIVRSSLAIPLTREQSDKSRVQSSAKEESKKRGKKKGQSGEEINNITRNVVGALKFSYWPGGVLTLCVASHRRSVILGVIGNNRKNDGRNIT